MGFKVDPETGKQRRGFAAMTLERRREIAAKGGASIPAGKRQFSRDPAMAREAGRKGGSVCKARREV